MKKKQNTWILGILLGSILVFTGCKGFEIQNIFMGKTNVVAGKVIAVFPSHESKTYNRKIKYAYLVNSNCYYDFFKLGTQDKSQVIGNGVQVMYSIKKPGRNRIKKINSEYNNSKGVKFYSTDEKGFIEMELINGVFKYKEFLQGGKLVNDFVGEYKLSKNNIIFKNYVFEKDSSKIYRPELFEVNAYNYNQLVDTKTKRIFKRID